MTKFTDEERVKKTHEIADYIIENKASTRKAGLRFGISNATVSDWMNYTLKKIDSKKYIMVCAVLKQNKPKTIKDESVSERVKSAALLIKEGFTVEEIAKVLDVTINVINEDLQTRLEKIDKELFEEIKLIQSKNSANNLNRGSAMSVEDQKRDAYGRFTK